MQSEQGENSHRHFLLRQVIAELYLLRIAQSPWAEVKLNKKKDSDSIDNIVKVLVKDTGVNLKRILPRELERVLPPEKKVVRRVAEDFAAGAEPARGVSHRFVNMLLAVTPEMQAVLKLVENESKQQENIKPMMWRRAVIRKALRQGVNVETELQGAIDLSQTPYAHLSPNVLIADEKFVRRTADEFRAGATPSHGVSHRFVNIKLSVTPEMNTAIKDAVAASGHIQSLWLRAAFRMVLREGIDAEEELNTEILLTDHLAP